MPYYNFKCPNCRKLYYVDSQYQHQHGLMFKCDGCGNEFPIDFFDYCPSCKQYVGFYNNYTTKEALLNIGSNAVLGFLNPVKGATKVIGSLLKDTSPNAGIGVCSMCGKKFVRCPKCGTLTNIPLHSSADETFLCSNCGTELTMDTEYVDEGAPVDDSVSNIDESQNNIDSTAGGNNYPSNNNASDPFTEIYNDFFADLDNFVDTKENLKDKFQELDDMAADLDNESKGRLMFLKAFACLCYIDNTGDTTCIDEAKTYLNESYKITFLSEIQILKNIFTFIELSERTYKNEDEFIDAYLIFKSIPPTPDESIKNTLINIDYYKEEYTLRRCMAVVIMLGISPIHTVSYEKTIELVDILCNSGNDNYAIAGWAHFGTYRYSEDDEIRCFNYIIDQLKASYPAYQEDKSDILYYYYTSALSTLGCDYLLFKEHQDISKGLMMLRDAVEKYNCPVALNALGKINLDGIGQAQDYNKAFKYFSETAQTGDSYGMYFLGVMYEKGLGVEKNIEEAIKWYQKADETNGYFDYFYGENLPNAKSKIRELKGSFSHPKLNNEPLTKEEQEYLDDLKDFMGDGELSPREQKMLDRMRKALGVSEARAKELEQMLNAVQLTDDEKEYKDMYDEYMAKGALTDKERRRLDKFAAALGISDDRKSNIENSSYSVSIEDQSLVESDEAKMAKGVITYLNRFVYEGKGITKEGLLYVIDNFFNDDCPDCKDKFEIYNALSLQPAVLKTLSFIEAVYYSLLTDEWSLGQAINRVEYYPQQTPVTLTGKFEELSNERLFLWLVMTWKLKRDFVSKKLTNYLNTKRHYPFVDFTNPSLPDKLLKPKLGWSFSQIMDPQMPQKVYKYFMRIYYQHFLDAEFHKGGVETI